MTAEGCTKLQPAPMRYRQTGKTVRIPGCYTSKSFCCTTKFNKVPKPHICEASQNPRNRLPFVQQPSNGKQPNPPVLGQRAGTATFMKQTTQLNLSQMSGWCLAATFFIALNLLTNTAQAAGPARECLSLDSDWRFPRELSNATAATVALATSAGAT